MCVWQNTNFAVQGPTQPSLLWYHPRVGDGLVSYTHYFLLDSREIVVYRRRMGHVQRQDENKKTDVHTHTNRVHCFTQYFDDIPFLEAAKREANLVGDTHDQLGDTLNF